MKLFGKEYVLLQNFADAQSAYEAEHELRLDAEKVAASAQARCEGVREIADGWRSAYDDLKRQIEIEREMHRDQLTAAFEHLAPLPKEPHFDPDDLKLKDLTPEEILARPVSTRQGMILRKRAAQDARERAMTDSQKAAKEERATLIRTEEEKRANSIDYDPVLGVETPKEPEDERAN